MSMGQEVTKIQVPWVRRGVDDIDSPPEASDEVGKKNGYGRWDKTDEEVEKLVSPSKGVLKEKYGEEKVKNKIKRQKKILLTPPVYNSSTALPPCLRKGRRRKEERVDQVGAGQTNCPRTMAGSKSNMTDLADTFKVPYTGNTGNVIVKDFLNDEGVDLNQISSALRICENAGWI